MTPQCPYCDNKNQTDFTYTGETATRDNNLHYILEYCQDTKGCGKTFLIVRNANNGNVIANFKLPEDWEPKPLPTQGLFEAEELSDLYSDKSREDQEEDEMFKNTKP